MAKELIISLIAAYGVYLVGSSLAAGLALREQQDTAKRATECARVTVLNPLIRCEEPAEL